MLFAKRQLQITKWKITKINFKASGGVPSQIDHFLEFKPYLAFLVNSFNVNVVGDGYPVHQLFVTNLTLQKLNWPKCKKMWL